MVLLHEEEDDHNHKETLCRGKVLVRTSKGTSTGEIVIVAKLGGHVLCHLASRLANVIREAD